MMLLKQLLRAPVKKAVHLVELELRGVASGLIANALRPRKAQMEPSDDGRLYLIATAQSTPQRSLT